MSEYRFSLARLLKNHFNLNLSRAKCLSALILTMISVRTVNLSVISEYLPDNATRLSWYRRLQRLITQLSLCQYSLAQIFVQIIGLDKIPKWTLCIDRTNWMFGKKHINILYLAVSLNNIAIPLFFSVLEDRSNGSCDHIDRIDILESFIKTFGKERIKVLTADREFIGTDWLKFLKTKQIPYVIRLKENGQMMANKNGVMQKISEIFRSMPRGEIVKLRRIIGTKGHISNRVHFVAVTRSAKGELLALIYNGEVVDPIASYAERWYIETMFKAFKSSGFNSEDTHITEYDRLEVLMSIMAIAFVISYKAGEIMETEQLTKIKTHGYRAQSIFRVGLGKLSNILVQIYNRLVEWNHLYASIIKGCTVMG